jgi:hypothetical protein
MKTMRLPRLFDTLYLLPRLHLAIDHVPLAQAALFKKFGKSDVYDFFAEIDFRHGQILQMIAQLLVQSLGQWLGQPKQLQMRPHHV